MADRGSRTPECMGVAADGGIIFLRGALFSDGHHKKKVCHACMYECMDVCITRSHRGGGAFCSTWLSSADRHPPPFPRNLYHPVEGAAADRGTDHPNSAFSWRPGWWDSWEVDLTHSSHVRRWAEKRAGLGCRLWERKLFYRSD